MTPPFFFFYRSTGLSEDETMWVPAVNATGVFKPPKHAYHACRPDLDDFSFVPHVVHRLDRVTHLILFLLEVVKAVACGSKCRSPFFHLSLTHAGALKWSALGQQNRGEKSTAQMMTRVDLAEMYEDGVLLPGNLIDLSSRQAAKDFLAPLSAMKGQLTVEQQEHLRLALQRGPNSLELLYCWRGKVPKDYVYNVLLEPLPSEPTCCLGNIVQLLRGKKKWEVGDVAMPNAVVRHWQAAHL